MHQLHVLHGVDGGLPTPLDTVVVLHGLVGGGDIFRVSGQSEVDVFTNGDIISAFFVTPRGFAHKRKL